MGSTDCEHSLQVFFQHKNDKRSCFYLYPDFPFYLGIKMQIKKKKKEKNPEMLSPPMDCKTMAIMHLFILTIKIKIEVKSCKPKSKPNFNPCVSTQSIRAFAWQWLLPATAPVAPGCRPTVGVHVHGPRASAARRDCPGVYKTALQGAKTAALHTVSRFCPRVKLPFHNFHYSWSWGRSGEERLVRCAAR